MKIIKIDSEAVVVIDGLHPTSPIKLTDHGNAVGRFEVNVVLEGFVVPQSNVSREILIRETIPPVELFGR